MPEILAGDPFEAVRIVLVHKPRAMGPTVEPASYLDQTGARGIQNEVNRRMMSPLSNLSAPPVNYDAYREWKNNSP